MNSMYLQRLLDAQHRILSRIVFGDSLTDCLTAICREIEQILSESGPISSILMLEGDKLFHGAAPSLPAAYCDAINGVPIGEAVGSCGTAAFRKARVIVSDIQNDPLWANYRHLAEHHGLRACWSTPILSSKGDVLGTFAIYYRTPETPDAFHIQVIERLTALASVTMEKWKAKAREEALVKALEQSNERFRAITQVIPDLALIINEDGEYVDIYGAQQTLLLRPREEMIGRKIADSMPEETLPQVEAVIQRALTTGKIQILEYQLAVQEGVRFFEGRIAPMDHYTEKSPHKRHVLWMARDITARKRTEEEVERLAYYDPLTSLPNRRLILSRIEMLIKAVRRNHKYGALLYLDLDDFKRINDSLGHTAGDELLIKVAKRLSPILRTSDTLARIGGDEFVVMLETIENDVDHLCEDATTVAKKIIHAFDESFRIRSGQYKIGCSVGIALIDSSTLDADDVLKRADTAMYKSKQGGGGHFSFFDPALQRIADYRLELEQDILHGIEARQFKAWYQPQIDVSGQVVGAEALVRWHHPQKGIIPPIEFIPIAEQFGLIDRLQDIVLEDACDLLNRMDTCPLKWNQSLFRVAINISASQFRRPDFAKEMMKRLSALNQPPERIKLEITESMLVENVQTTTEQMNTLRAQGLRFSVDDFGTGYSSLTYLHSFPIDELKIDKSFVDKIESGDANTAIIDTIIALAHNLGFRVVAEGVETPVQADVLANKAVHAMQGYLFARPMPEEDFTRWLVGRS